MQSSTFSHFKKKKRKKAIPSGKSVGKTEGFQDKPTKRCRTLAAAADDLRCKSIKMDKLIEN